MNTPPQLFSRHWFQRARASIMEMLEVVLLAFFMIIASRYWSISEHVAYISLFAATAVIAVTRGITGPLSVRRFLPLIAFTLFIGWIVLSSIWSPNFHLSLGRAMTVGLVAAIGVAIGFALNTVTMAKGLVFGVVTLVAHATLISGWHPLRAFLPHNADDSATGSAEPGLFTNISDMTYLLGVGLVASTLLALRRRSTAIATAPIIVLFLLSAIGIPQMTMFFAVATAAAVGLMLIHMRYSSENLRKLLRVVYPALVLIGAALFWIFREPILRPLGEDPNLSGRTIIWDWYLEAFFWEPVIGIGWGNTYNWPLKPGDTYPTGQYFVAHNGFIDIGLATGGVGVALIVATLVLVFLRGSMLAMNRAKPLTYLFIPTLITYIVVSDVGASSLPRYIGVLLVGSLVGLVVSDTTKVELTMSPASSRGVDTGLGPRDFRAVGEP